MNDSWMYGNHPLISSPAAPDGTLDSRRGQVHIAESFMKDIFLPKGTVIKTAHWDSDKHVLVVEICHKDLDIIDDDDEPSPMVMIDYERVTIERKFIK